MTNKSDSRVISRYSFLFLFTLALLLMLIPEVVAQDLSSELDLYNSHRIDLNKTGMLVLSGWALGNIALGSYGYFRTGGKNKYFHQMNAAWNLVNLSIGAFAYYNYLHADPSSFSLAESMREAQSMENILLLNIGLDVGYIATGAFLWERGIRKDNDRLLGYGPSLILQGGFLLVFDAILYGLNRTHNEKLFNLIDNVTLSASLVSVNIPL